MFFGQAPEFGAILDELKALEVEINSIRAIETGTSTA